MRVGVLWSVTVPDMALTRVWDMAAPQAARIVLPYLVLLLLVVVDGLTGRDEPLAGTFGVATLVAAGLSGPRATAGAGGVVVVVAVLASWWENTSTEAAAVRVLIVVACSVGAVLLARHGQRRESDYLQVRAVADAAQLAVLRPVPTSVAGVRVAARYVSAARFAHVGGDFYEVVPWDSGVRLVVGDVRGKGLDAVGLAAVALGVFREAAATETSIDDVAVRVDRRLRQYLGEEDFVTAIFGEVRRAATGPCVQLVSCGHPAPLLVREGQVSTVQMASRPPLGLGDPAWWADDVDVDGTVELALAPTDRVLLYTDGLVEARDAQRRFVPLQRLTAALVPATTAEAPDVALERLLTLLRRSTGGPLGDDLALLLLQNAPHDTGPVSAPIAQR